MTWYLRISAILTLLLSVLAADTVWADSSVIHGLSFQIEKSRRVGSGATEVSIHGHQEIVANDSLDDYVVDVYFPPELSQKSSPPPGARFSLAQLRSFILEALEEGYPSRARQAALTLVLSLNPSESDLLRLLRAAPFEHRSASFYRDFGSILVDQKQYSRAAVYALFALSSLQEVALSEFMASAPESFRSEFLHLFKEVLLREYLSNERSLLDGAAQLAPQLSRGRSEAIRFVTTLQGAGKGQALVTAIRLLETQADVSPDLYRTIPPYLKKKTQELVSNDQFEEALSKVTSFPFERRTPAVHEAVLLLIDAVATQQPLTPLSPRVQQLLVEYGAVDEEIHQALVRLARNAILLLLEREDLDRLPDIWRFLMKLEPASSSVKRDLRLEIIRKSLRLGRGADFRDYLIGELPMGSRIWTIFLWLFYSFPMLETVVSLVVILGGLALLNYRVRALREKPDGAAEEVFGHGAASTEASSRRRFVRNAARRASRDPRIEEYFYCLAELGLKGRATSGQIKAAYRQLLKEEHPDLQEGEAEKTATERFMKIRSSYERLLALEQDAEFNALLNTSPEVEE